MAQRKAFGLIGDDTVVEAVELDNANGTRARIITLGATLQSLTTPDRTGQAADVVLGHDTLEPYLDAPNYFGGTIGRYANRIAAGTFSLDGRRYTLARNDGPNALHGGVRGFDRVVWCIEKIESGSTASVGLSYRSCDGEEGYPGNLSASVTYTLSSSSELTIAYEATTDKPTIVNLTNHSFFNLCGATSGRNILNHRLTIEADLFTPVKASLIPTGEFRSVRDTPFDFRQPAEIGARIRAAKDTQILIARGYDHNWVLRGGETAEARTAARLQDPDSGRVLEVLTTEPGLQFYSGNFLDGTQVGKGGLACRQSDGLCLEPQRFPDSPNQPTFPSARLDPGDTYRHVIVLRLSTAPPTLY